MEIVIPKNISLEAQAYYQESFPDLPLIDFNSLEQITQLRQAFTPIWEALSEQISYDYSFEEIRINGTRCYQIDPPNLSDANQLVLYIHGGAFIFGHPSLCKNIPVSIAHGSGIRTVSIEYPLAPEHSFQDQLDHILAVIEGIREKFGREVNYGLVGHSAGGCLALSALLQARLRKAQLPTALCLISPWLDSSVSGDTMTTLEAFDPNPPSTEWFYESVDAILGDMDRTDPLISPLYGDLQGLCPTYIQQAGRDKISSDAFRLNRELLKQNVPTTLDVWDGMWHGFQMFPAIPEAKSANQFTADFLKYQLGKLG